MLGMSLVGLEQPKFALPYFQRRVELNQEDVEARFQYGLCLANQEYIDEAIDSIRKVYSTRS